MSLLLTTDANLEIRKQLEAGYPNEACGFLLGVLLRETKVITRAVRANNISEENQKRFFLIDPLDYLKVEKNALRDGLRLLGIYHSHPDHPAIPSQHDLEFAQPDFSYIILSVKNGVTVDLKSYLLNEEKFIEERVYAEKPAIIEFSSSN